MTQQLKLFPIDNSCDSSTIDSHAPDSRRRLTFKLLSYWIEAVQREGWRIEFGADPHRIIAAAIVSIYAETGSETETANRLGVDRTTIGAKLKDLGIEVKPKGGSNNPYGRAGSPKKRQAIQQSLQ